MEKRWILNAAPDESEVESFSKLLSIEKPLASLLISRGIRTLEDAELFFNPDISKLHDPFLMKDRTRPLTASPAPSSITRKSLSTATTTSTALLRSHSSILS